MVFEGLLALLSSAFCLTSYIEDTNNFPKPLSAEKEKEFFAAYRAGDISARDKLVSHNMRLVVHMAKKYVGSFDPDDIISVGAIGLLKAINSFEYSKGTQFATYAAKCIENEILMTIRANKKNKVCVSMYTPIGMDKDGNEISLIDTIESPEEDVAVKIEKEAIYAELRDILKKVLTERENQIICMRYGIGDVEILPQREIAKKFNISRSYISRIEKKALQKLKTYIMKNKIELR